MLVTAVTFPQVVIAIHVIGIVAAFGIVLAYPLIAAAVRRADPGALPTLHRARQYIGRVLVNPALALVLVSGIYLASDLHDWKQFFVQWGVAMVVVLGALEGAVVIRNEGKLAEAGGSGSADVSRAQSLSTGASWVMTILVIITIYLMVVQAG